MNANRPLWEPLDEASPRKVILQKIKGVLQPKEASLSLILTKIHVSSAWSILLMATGSESSLAITPSMSVVSTSGYQVPLLMKIASPQAVPPVRSILFLSFTKKRKQFLVAPVPMAAFQAGPSPDSVVFWLIVDLRRRAKIFVVLDLLVIVLILLAEELSAVLVKGLRLSTLWLII